MQQTLRTDIYKDIKYYNWRLTNDVEDNKFKSLVDKIINSNQSCFVTGPRGSGKTTLLKLLQDELTQQDKKKYNFMSIQSCSINSKWYYNT
jgi:predicted AAA+ superfamily ATPase